MAVFNKTNYPPGSATSMAVLAALGISIPGRGVMEVIPAVVGFGTPLFVNALGGQGVRLYLFPNDTLSYTIAESQPMSTPVSWVLSGSRASSKDEPILGVDVFITGWTGTPRYRIL